MKLTDPNSRLERATRGFPYLFLIALAVCVLMLWPLGRVPYGWWFPVVWAAILIVSIKRLEKLRRADQRT